MQITVFAAAAQHCKATFLGSKTLYVSNRIPSPAPKGYTPVFINYVGRHGARHLTSDVMASEIGQLLVKADSAGGLTPAGKRLQEKVMQLAKVEKPNIKSISYEGILEQQGLASRMFTNYPTVFDYPRPVINIAYTKEIRTWQTSKGVFSRDTVATASGSAVFASTTFPLTVPAKMRSERKDKRNKKVSLDVVRKFITNDFPQI